MPGVRPALLQNPLRTLQRTSTIAQSIITDNPFECVARMTAAESHPPVDLCQETVSLPVRRGGNGREPVRSVRGPAAWDLYGGPDRDYRAAAIRSDHYPTFFIERDLPTKIFPNPQIIFKILAPRIPHPTRIHPTPTFASQMWLNMTSGSPA
jgi:hypothetical protein